MKKLLFVFSMFVAMSACSGNGQKPEVVENDSIAVDSFIVDSVDTTVCGILVPDTCPE